MQKRHVEIGAEFGKLVVIGYAESDEHGNQRVVVRCACAEQKVKTVRLTALTFEPYEDKNGKLRLPHRSCGCESKRAHKEYWELRARGIKKRVRKRIWKAHQDGLRFDELALKFRLEAGVISAICRIENVVQLPAKGGAIPKNSKAREQWITKIGGDLPF